MKTQPTLGLFALLTAIALGVVLCIWVITKGETTPTEALLLSVFLTLLSALGSWLTSHYYSEYSSGKNLRMFALKAAEKVTNLSNELDRLSAFLQQELEAEDYEAAAQ